MTSTYFPINQITFVEDCIEHITNFDDWTDEFHEYIDTVTSNNSTQDNIILINHYIGDIFNAIKLYKDEYGEFIIPDDKHMFYAQLAFAALYHHFYDEVSQYIDDVNNDNYSNADTIPNTTSDTDTDTD